MEHTGICHSDGFDLAYRIEGEGAPILVIGSAVYYPRLFFFRHQTEISMGICRPQGICQAKPGIAGRGCEA